MPRFSANLSMLFTELPFEQRFAAAAKAGFKAVEFMYPYEYKKEDIAGWLQENSLQLVLFNLPAGNREAGEKGVAVLGENRSEEFKAGILQGLEYALALKVPHCNCLLGCPKEPEEVVRPRLVERLRWACDQFAAKGLTIIMEPLNRKDTPGFYMSTTGEALALINEVDKPNLKIQYDVYHAQRMEGDILATVRASLALIPHIQISDNPGRHQPGTGEINYANVLKGFDQMGYKGWVGLEYNPTGETLASFDWLEKLGFSI